MEFLATIVKVDKFLTSEKLPKWPLIWLWSQAGFLWPSATPNQPPGQSLQKPKWMLLFPHTDSHGPSFTRQDSCFRGLHAKFLPVPTDQSCLSYVQRGLDLPRPPKSAQNRHFGLCTPVAFHLPSLGHAHSDRCSERNRVPNLFQRHQKLYSQYPVLFPLPGPICRQWEAGLLCRKIPGKNLINQNPSIMHKN